LVLLGQQAVNRPNARSVDGGFRPGCLELLQFETQENQIVNRSVVEGDAGLGVGEWRQMSGAAWRWFLALLPDVVFFFDGSAAEEQREQKPEGNTQQGHESQPGIHGEEQYQGDEDAPLHAESLRDTEKSGFSEFVLEF
jgi:hypothetical protein